MVLTSLKKSKKYLFILTSDSRSTLNFESLATLKYSLEALFKLIGVISDLSNRYECQLFF